MSTLFKTSIVTVFLLWTTSAIVAQTVTGTVHNQTTGKPSAGDEVVLMRLGEGMEEQGHTKTSDQGTFTLNAPSSAGQYLIQVTHQGVSYPQPVAGPGSVQINVYDTVASVPALRGPIGIAQIESDGKVLKVTEMYDITNTSNPPVTQLRSDNFEMNLPAQAVVDSVLVRREQGIWLKATANPVKGQKGRYDINFPIRPGATLFKFTYHLPYEGSTTLHLRLPYPIERFAVMHPPSIVFKALLTNTFISPPELAGGLKVEAAVAQPTVGDVPAFEISGVGKAPEHGTEAGTGASAPAAAAPPSNVRAVPVNSPAAATGQSTKEMWLMIIGIAAILIVSTYAMQRSKRRPVMVSSSTKPGGQTPLLDALKEQLFQLESDRLHGSISAEEYATHKRALNESIQRALARK